MAKRIVITNRYIQESQAVVSSFGSVRASSFLRYIALTLEASPDASVKIMNGLLRNRHFVKTSYSGTDIIKLSEERTASYDGLDAFEAYLSVLEEEKATDPDADVMVRKTKMPTDYVFGTTSGLIYDVIINNERGPQKVKMLEKTDTKRYKNQITLFVYTSGTDLAEQKKPALPGKSRIGVVRRDRTGRAKCMLSAMEG